MQPLYEDKWTSTLDREVPNNNLLIKLEDDFDIGLILAHRGIFNKSIEKFKDVNTMRLCCITHLLYIYGNNIKVESLKDLSKEILFLSCFYFLVLSSRCWS